MQEQTFKGNNFYLLRFANSPDFQMFSYTPNFPLISSNFWLISPDFPHMFPDFWNYFSCFCARKWKRNWFRAATITFNSRCGSFIEKGSQLHVHNWSKMLWKRKSTKIIWLLVAKGNLDEPLRRISNFLLNRIETLLLIFKK